MQITRDIAHKTAAAGGKHKFTVHALRELLGYACILARVARGVRGKTLELLAVLRGVSVECGQHLLKDDTHFC